jgi:hypothetical protein
MKHERQTDRKRLKEPPSRISAPVAALNGPLMPLSFISEAG